MHRQEEEPAVCPICKGVGYRVKDVPVGHPDFGQLVPCQCKARELEHRRLAALRAVSNVNLLSHMTFDTFVPEGYGLNEVRRKNLRDAYNLARQFAEKPEGWLVLLGGYGCGKTHLAAAIANHRLSLAQPALFIVVPDLLDHLRAAFGPASAVPYDEQFEAVRNTPLLILDDLGTENATPWVGEKLYQIFNHRYNARLPTVITSNRELEEIDERLRSRMNDQGFARIHKILAHDFRGSPVDLGRSELSCLDLLHDMTFDTFDPDRPDLEAGNKKNLRGAYAIARDYARNPEGWLVLTGPYGCGKTHLAAAIANYRVDQGYPALFVVVPDLLDHLRATFSPTSPISLDKRFDEVRMAPFLVLDDLGTESATPWAREKLYQLFNYRYNARLPTVVTTSDRIDDVDPRLRTRMLDLARCTIWAITAGSYRGGGQLPKKRPRATGGRRSRKGVGVRG